MRGHLITSISTATIGAVTLAVATAGVLTSAAPAGAAEPFGPTPWVVGAPGAGPAKIWDGAGLGDRLVYSYETPAYGAEPWVSDGTVAGTHLLVDITPGPGGSGADEFVQVGSLLLFHAEAPGLGDELWATDGTTDGTRLVKDLWPGAASSSPDNQAAAGRRLFFNADTPGVGRELWVSDGTAAGTHLVEDLNPGVADSSPGNLTAVGNRVVFHATNATIGREPFVSDGTPTGTHQIGNISLAGDSDPRRFTVLGAAVLFPARSDTDGVELYRWSGTGVQSTLVRDISPGVASSYPEGLTVYQGRVYFSAQHPATGGDELWSTDGTTDGTYLAQQINPVGPGAIGDLTVHGDRLYFEGRDGPETTGLFSSTGTAASTRLVLRLTTPGGAASVHGLHPAGDLLLFSRSTTSPDTEAVWITDGTTAGSRPLLAAEDPASPVATTLATVANTAFVVATAPGVGERLWAYTWRSSETVVTAKRKWSAKKARKRKIKLTIEVSAAGVTPDGAVTIWTKRKGKGLKTKQKRLRAVGTAVVVDGIVRVRIKKRLKAGKYKITATYAGSLEAGASTSAPRTIKVRR
ncbi:Ig-like domain repeat protein [Nocardioides sp. LHD-245]|uniref:ELWxxDGT repeat protein n=1 Tax=Nocardioides sp. LHD-245 TaxID=3051387 RepID=UPI0027DF8985|nr:Ig-like domain repeat protein [Nocardioides sp. LHD-245]